MRPSPSLTFGSIAVRPPLVFPGQRIGLLGGSFNPAHDGHRQISLFALKRLGLSQVWWIVSPGNPLKSRAELGAFETRIEEAVLVAHDPRIKVTGFEARLPSSYTFATLAFLRQRYPGVYFVWIMGADNLATFHRWRNWRDIAQTMPIAVIDRPGWRLRAMASKTALGYRNGFIDDTRAHLLPARAAPAWTVLTVPLSPLSSTTIRRARRQNH